MATGTALFVYGTLMSDQLLFSLTGRRFPRCPAILADHARVFPEGLGGYADVTPRAGEQVIGVLLEDIDAASLCALDAYEDLGRLYQRREVQVSARGIGVTCDVYVTRGV